MANCFCVHESVILVVISRVAKQQRKQAPKLHWSQHKLFVMRIHPSTYIHVPFNGVSSIMLCPTLALQASLSSGSTLARPHLSTYGVTHSDNVLRGLPFFLLPGSGNFVKYLIDGMDRFTLPYHLSHRQQRTNVMSLMPSFSSSEAEGVLSLSLMPQIQWVMTRPLHWRHRSLGSFGPHVSLPWSWANAGLVHFATYSGWEVSSG